MNRTKHPLFGLMCALLAWPAFATQGTHVETEELRAMLEVRTVEVEKTVETEVVREVAVPTSDAVERISAGLGGDTSAGCDLPDVTLGYDREATAFAAHGRVKVGGNRACRTAVSADIGIERDFGHVSIDIGYDRRGVSFAGPSTDGPDDVFYGSMSAVSAAINADVDFGAANFEGGWDLPAEAPRFAVSVPIFGARIDADMTRYPSRGVVTNASVAWRKEVAGGFGVEARASWTRGLGNAPDPVDWRSDSGRLPLDPPDSAYSYGISVTKVIRGAAGE